LSGCFYGSSGRVKKGPAMRADQFRAFLVALVVSIGGLGTVHAATLDANTESRISGRDDPARTTFSATRLQDPEDIRVEISLPNAKAIIALVNYSTQSLSIRSIARGTGKPIALSAEDVKALKELSRGLPPMHNKIGDALGSVISYVSETPVGVIIEINISPSDDDGKPKADFDSRSIKSLCTVRRAVGFWDVNQNKFSKATDIGPCYNAANECMGRCGAGCASNPPNNGHTVQRFTQHCLNHDLCTRATGAILGQCKDEWLAAADDFIFGRDCADMTGNWTDTIAREWSLNQKSDNSVGGTVTGTCGVAIVTGSHFGKSFSLTATLRSPPAGCCSAFRYKGILRTCGSASVAWTNVCTQSGATTMTREAGRLESSVPVRVGPNSQQSVSRSRAAN
jgi:hypothetical protein